MSESESILESPTTAYILPLIVFLIVATFYPNFAESYAADGLGGEPPSGATRETQIYLAMVGIQVVIASALVFRFRNVYQQEFPFRVSWMAVPVGIVGVVLWILLTEIGVESALLGKLGVETSRPSFNPFTIDDATARGVFLVSRFPLLPILVPIVEELFLRGWLMRWIENPDFQAASLKQLGVTALLSASAYGVLTHPSEAIAAFVWFGWVTLLMRWTGNLWDCVVAHGVTNLLLGVYVVVYAQWHLW